MTASSDKGRSRKFVGLYRGVRKYFCTSASGKVTGRTVRAAADHDFQYFYHICKGRKKNILFIKDIQQVPSLWTNRCSGICFTYVWALSGRRLLRPKPECRKSYVFLPFVASSHTHCRRSGQPARPHREGLPWVTWRWC